MKAKSTLFRKLWLICLLAVILSTTQYSQVMTFDITDFEAGPADASWMFDADDPTYFTHDGSPFTFEGEFPYSNYAYREFTWDENADDGDGKLSASTCTFEAISNLAGTAGVTLKLYNFVIASFEHINTTDRNANWSISGQAGDRRNYVGGIGEIYVDDVLKFRATNCRLTVTVPYPTEAEMEAIYGGNFTNNIGTGAEVTGSGWGEIDAAASDDIWEADIDINNTDQVSFSISSISSVIQNYYGYYDMTINVNGSNVVNDMRFDAVAVSGDGVFDNGVSIHLDSGTDGHETTNMSDGNRLFANRIGDAAGGTLPDGINLIYDGHYWELGTTYGTFQTDVTFDISTIPGITDPANLRILKRATPNGNWVVYGDFTRDGSATLTANNVTSFSDFAIGSIGADALPVELTSFTANQTSNSVTLTWQTVTEVNNYGFEIERQTVETLRATSNEWQTIGFVEGHGNSNSPKDYTFTDDLLNLSLGLNLNYRLKQLDFDGNYKYSDVVEVKLVENVKAYKLEQNYPNPFNPSTVIKYSIPTDVRGEMQEVRLTVYDILGNEVATLVKENQKSGNYEVKFDASNFSSGLYFYRISAGNFVDIKKMILIK